MLKQLNFVITIPNYDMLSDENVFEIFKNILYLKVMSIMRKYGK